MFFLAVRHLSSKKRQTILTISGISLGAAAYVAIAGLMLGFQTFIIDQLVNNDSHIRISAREEYVTPESVRDGLFPNAEHVFWFTPPSGRRDSAKIEYPSLWFDRLQKDDEVLAFSPQLVSQVIVRRGKITTTARLIGSEPARQSSVTNIENYMLQGKFSDIGMSGNKIAVGSGLLKRLGARVSETIFISTGKREAIPFRIVGSFQIGVKGVDDTTIFGALSDVQKVNQTPSQISDIAVKLFDVARAADIAFNWAALSPDKVQSWDQANEGAMSVFKTQDIVRNTMTFSILIVAGFGIYNILTMAVNQKRKEIAILRSMGYEPGDIVRLFLIQGLILGGIGSLIGISVGYFACVFLSHIEVSAQRGIGGNTMMVSFAPTIYLFGAFIGILAATVASFLPARAAGKMEPIDIIRSEGS